jgi:hypothetical protein
MTSSAEVAAGGGHGSGRDRKAAPISDPPVAALQLPPSVLASGNPFKSNTVTIG